MIKKALILGVTGQDGSYLLDLLIKKKYEVHGLIRKSATGNTKNIDHSVLSTNVRLCPILLLRLGMQSMTLTN